MERRCGNTAGLSAIRKTVSCHGQPLSRLINRHSLSRTVHAGRVQEDYNKIKEKMEKKAEEFKEFERQDRKSQGKCAEGFSAWVRVGRWDQLSTSIILPDSNQRYHFFKDLGPKGHNHHGLEALVPLLYGTWTLWVRNHYCNLSPTFTSAKHA